MSFQHILRLGFVRENVGTTVTIIGFKGVALDYYNDIRPGTYSANGSRLD